MFAIQKCVHVTNAEMVVSKILFQQLCRHLKYSLNVKSELIFFRVYSKNKPTDFEMLANCDMFGFGIVHVILESLAATCPGEAPPGYTYINGKYYRYETANKAQYLPAANACKLEGARIATMKTPQEFSAIWLNISIGESDYTKQGVT